MKKLYLTLLIIFPVFIFGQETIKKTKSNTSPIGTEIYHVLKSDKSILHGSYQKLNYSNQLIVDGYYNKGAKDSTWTEYIRNGKVLKSGKYLADKRVGLWEFYNYDGQLEQTYDYSTNKLVFLKTDPKQKELKYTVITDTGLLKTKLERAPIYIDGSGSILNTISSNIRYPIRAMEKGISGKVVITFTIDKEGKTSNYRVTKGIGSGCDEEALRVMKMTSDSWLPSILDGQTVSVDYYIPVIFRMR